MNETESKIRAIIANWSARLLADPSLGAKLPGSYLFKITNLASERSELFWHLVSADQVKCDFGEISAECTVEVDSESLINITEGRLNPQVAFFQGRIRVKGDLDKALQLGELFRQQVG